MDCGASSCLFLPVIIDDYVGVCVSTVRMLPIAPVLSCACECVCSCTCLIVYVSWARHREETKCIEKAVAVLALMVVVVVGDELQPASPDRLAPEGLHPGTELPLSG